MAAHAASPPSDHEAAAALRRSLVPAALPRIPAAELAARYVPGQGKIGGDWYDVFTLPTGEHCAVIGDVAGSGLQAAVIMGRMRSTLRSYALETSDPADILGRLDRKMQYFEPGALATVACAVLDPVMATARISLAGHLPAILASPGQGARLAGDAGDLLIGASPQVSRRTATMAIPPGSVLCLFTDGLVERRGQPLDEGIARMLRSVTAAQPDSLCTAIMNEMTAGEEVPDDLSLLILRRSPRRAHHDSRQACRAMPGGAGDRHAGPRIRLASIYEPPSAADGRRVLTDPAWPRALANSTASVDDWIPAAAPSARLRRRLAEDRSRFGEFRRCYLAELREPQRARALARLRHAARRHTVTLLTAEPDIHLSPAAVLAGWLQAALAPVGPPANARAGRAC
jgi:uncharacterized protein YeaO (DUF488 family)